MKPILALVAFFIFLINHFITFGVLPSYEKDAQLKSESIAALALQNTDSDKTVNHIAKLFGEKYAKKSEQKKEKTKQPPKVVNVSIQIESIYRIGNNAKVRVNTQKNKSTLSKDLSVGEELYGYKLVKVDTKVITFKKDDTLFPIEVYKPQSLKVKE